MADIQETNDLRLKAVKVSMAILMAAVTGCDTSQLAGVGVPTPAPEPSPFLLTGDKNQATEKFALAGGMTVVRYKYEGTSNFIVWLVDKDGKQKSLAANEIGTVEGSQGFGSETGTFSFNVTAQGSWSVKVEQPRPTTASETTAFSGSGNTLVGPFKMSAGAKTFSTTYSGDSNFIIWLLDSKGQQTGLVANEIGTSTSSKTLAGTDGIFFMNVQANGPWSVNIK